MATTDGPDATKHLPVPEHDKLGPLGARPSALEDPADLRTKLLGEFGKAVQSAVEAATSAEHGSAVAVHNSRKALRRARAVLAMVARALPKSERSAVRTALQEARRSLSTIRDHSVAPETLGQLVLSDDDRDTAKRVVDNAAEAIPAISEIKQLLGEAAARAAAQGEALEAALSSEISWDTVTDGIRDVYGDARKARRSSKSSKPWFHTWRRRSKELVYQLEFVAKHAGPRGAAIQAELAGVTDALGPAVDLVMLREFVETHGQGIASSAIGQLRDTIDSQLEELMKEARKAARDAFSLKPKKFQRRLVKAVKRDLTPADDDDRANGDAT
ncbi:MAG: CHAD domain-containing protein [Kofleriaceae bacterium]